jgi:hypothetical protein
MPRYFFNVLDGSLSFTNERGKELSNLQEAHLHALRILENVTGRTFQVITHAPDSGAQALMVVRMVPKTVVPDVRRAVSTTVRTAASPSAAHMAR